jgi:hypothetical protein
LTWSGAPPVRGRLLRDGTRLRLSVEAFDERNVEEAG